MSRRIQAATAAPTRPFLNDLPRRAYLTVKHHGWRELLDPHRHLAAAPVSGSSASLRRGCRAWADQPAVRGWYRREGRPVTIVMPTYGDPSTTIDAVTRLRRTLKRGRTRIVVVDDGSEPEHQSA